MITNNWNEFNKFNLITITIDMKGNITNFSKFAEILTGYNSKEVIGKNWIDFFVDEAHKEKTSSLFYNSVLMGKKHWSCKNIIKCKDKTTREITWKTTFIHESNEKTMIALFGVDTTITQKMDSKLFKDRGQKKNNAERIKNEIEKKKQEDVFLKTSKMAALGEMMYAIVHQWKQPLNTLRLHSDFIESKLKKGLFDPGDFQKFSNKMRIQIDHLNNTIKDLRNFFQMNQEKETFYLRSLLHSILNLIEDDFIINKIDIRIEETNTVKISGIKNELQHVILNLIHNAKDAFKANDIKKRLLIFRLYDDLEYTYFELEDNAGGINKDIIDKIFELHFSTRDKETNDGMGLYIASKIVQNNNGTLLVANSEKGAIFTIKLKKEISCKISELHQTTSV